MRNMNAFLLLGAMLTTALFTSCGSLEITKRRHMPGYHVELNNGKQHQSVDRDQAHAKEQPARSTKEMEAIEVKSSTVESSATLTEMLQSVAVAAAFEVSPAKTEAPQQRLLPSINEGTVKMGSALRRSVFAEEGDEKYGWSIIAFIAFGLGVIAFVMMFVALFWMIALGPLWFVPAIVGLLFGIAALITGVIGLKKTKRGGKRGRGFALAGMIAGILGLVISLVVLAVGAFRTFINNN